ncbi:MAG: class I SAM-dependent methyltransferase [Microthrixaceae bacterium]
MTDHQPPAPGDGRHRLARGLALVTAGLVLGNGVRLRRRAEALPTLGDPPSLDGRSSQDEYVFWVAEGVRLDDATRAAAVAHLEASGADAVDVIPANLPTLRALDVLRMVDPRSFGGAPMAQGRGAFQLICARAAVAERARLTPGEGVRLQEMVNVTLELKRHAPRSMHHVVAPHLRAAPTSAPGRAEVAVAVYGAADTFVHVVGIARFVVLAALAVLAPASVLLALAALIAQPHVVLGGQPITPGDLTAKSLLRPATEPIEALATMSAIPAARKRSTAPAALRRRDPAVRAEYAEDAATGIDRFFEPHRTTCPWCGAAELSRRLDTVDLLQHKPGTFRIDRCDSCGHLFQNPRLTTEGLDYYYRDFYDGIGAESADFIFGVSDTSYVDRAELVKRHATAAPENWLDVGTGHGHFCLIAADVLPETTFDGLDLSDGVDDAARRGWISTGHRGLFPELSAGLAGQYDVVSMHHYLEHTREPLDELEAAAETLRPGGMLLIEVPNPECALGGPLGRYWVPWFQPQHQHLVPRANLCAALEQLGFEILDQEVAEAHQPVDLSLGAWFALNRIAPELDLPWMPPSRPVDRLRRAVALTAGAPLMVAGLIGDHLLAPAVKRVDGGNTYRVLARLPAEANQRRR